MALRMFAETGQEMLAAKSYAKYTGLYRDRVGALSVSLSESKHAKQENQLQLVHCLPPSSTMPSKQWCSCSGQHAACCAAHVEHGLQQRYSSICSRGINCRIASYCLAGSLHRLASLVKPANVCRSSLPGC